MAPGSNGERHRQGVKGVGRHRGSAGGFGSALILQRATGLKERPAKCTHYQAAGDAYHGQRDAEELKNIRADEQRTEQ
jgi:hypothetical protein